MMAVQGAANYFIEDEASKDAIKYSEARSQVIGDAAVAAAVQKFSQLSRRGIQEREASSRQIQNIARQARQAGGGIKAGAGASGVEGNSIDALTRDFEAQELARIEVTRTDLANTEQGIQDQFKGVSAEAESRIFNAAGNPVARPSIFGALLSIGTSSFAAYADNSSIKEDGDRKLDP
jgi:hypothetical protein